jgi:hypothetical protein
MQREHHPSPASIDRLANTLFDLAGYHGVRVIEALAAVLTRRGAERLGRPSGLSEPAAGRPFTTLAEDEDSDARRAICRRIARRALHGSLIDPTQGATAMHRIDDVPAWSRDHLPIGMFGPFLFYRLAPEQLASLNAPHSPVAKGISDPEASRREVPDTCW